MSIDFERIASEALARIDSLIKDIFPLAKLQGHEYVVGDLNGNPGSSLSINRNTGLWGDFAAGVKGKDLIALLAARDNMSQKDAAEELAMMMGLDLDAPPPPPRKPAAVANDDYVPDLRPPSPAPNHVHPRLGKASQTWIYRSLDGALIHYVSRFNTADGKKEIAPQTYGSYKGQKRWGWKHIPDNRPLYNLPDLRQHPTRKVVIVEGEKTADAAKMLLPKNVVVTWSGGTNAVHKTDWSPLAGRKVIIWPDADHQKKDAQGNQYPKEQQPGIKAARAIKQELEKVGAEAVAILSFDFSKRKCGWDAADALQEGWTSEEAYAFLKEALSPAPPQPEPEVAAPGKEEVGHPAATEPSKPKTKAVNKLEDAPFNVLGHWQGQYYYFSHRSSQIVGLSARDHVVNQLLQLAPLDWWRHHFKGDRKETVAIAEAADYLMSACIRRGIFDPDCIRGRGAWWDNGRTVFHIGNRLIVDGALTPLELNSSRYVYEAAPAIEPPSQDPLDIEDARVVLELAEKFRWASPIYARLLAGWCVIAPICGALRWRPHIWITGAAGSGKTWIQTNYTHKLVGNFALYIQGESTESGIRQKLKQDARPVMFDEAEAEDKRGQDRMNQIFALMRQSSAESGAKIYKGSAGGHSAAFNVRSCFCLSSIGVNIKQYADETRISVLQLKRSTVETDDEKQFERDNFAMLEELARQLDETFSERLFARTIRMVSVIRTNAERFATAVALVTGSQRHGDQLGTLLAGCYALESDEVIDLQDAKAYVASCRALDVVKGLNEQDDMRCFNHLMDQIIKVQASGGLMRDYSIQDLVEALLTQGGGFSGIRQLEIDQIERALKNHGLLYKDRTLIVANNHDKLAKIYADTPWASGWANTLRQMPQADNCENQPIRFATTRMSKATRIRLDELADGPIVPPEQEITF